MKNRAQDIRKVLWQILALNVAVATGKAVWGLLSGSEAMLADGIHSFTDGTGNVVALFAMRVAGRPLNEKHPYGHHKYESIASAVIGVMLSFGAYKVASGSVVALMAFAKSGAAPRVEVTVVSFAIMLVTLVINVFVVWFETRRGRALDSDALQSDAKHTLSDIWVTLGVLVSLALVKLGVAIADPIVGLLVAVAIAWAAVGVLRDVGATFSDVARLDPHDVHRQVLAFSGVKGCHNIRTRGTGSVIHMDLSVLVNPGLTVEAGHAIARDLEAWLCGHYPGLVDVVIHVEPDDEQQRKQPPLAARVVG